MKTKMEAKQEKVAEKPRFGKRLWDAGKKLMAGTLACAVLALPFYSRPAMAEGKGWAIAWPGYVLHANKPTLRIEGGASFDTGTSVYAFTDFEPSKDNSVSFDTFYGEGRIAQELFKGLAAYAEVDAGSGMDSVFRPGLMYSASPGGFFLLFRVSPWSMGGAEDIQLVAYASKTFADRVFMEVLVKANILAKTIYSELGVGILFGGRLSAGIQLRMFTELEEKHTDVAPVARLGVRF